MFEMDDTKDILKLFDEKKLVKICAPMVRYSKIQFRNLVREYDCDLCYTPMIIADSFCRSEKARKNEFTTNLNDSPVIVQFAAKTVQDFVGAAYMVSPYCSGVDLNCGCPQQWAKQMGIGSSLLNNPDLICDLIKQCRNRINKPFTISVKLRIIKDVRKMIEICKQIEKSGVSFISVHGRTASQHTGDIDLEILKLISENIDCPLVTNGGIKNLNDCFKLQKETKCKGVMVANGLLTNPTLFSGTEITTEDCIQKWINICYNTTLKAPSSSNKRHFNVIPERPPNLTFQCFHHHLVFMLEKLLPKNKRRIFNNLQNFHDVLSYLYEQFRILPQGYNAKAFEFYKILDLNYDDRDQVYFEYDSGNVSSCNSYQKYSYDSRDGKFFKSKIDDISLIENDLQSVFI